MSVPETSRKNIKCINTQIIGIPEEEEKEKGPEKIFEEILVKGTWNILQDNHILGHESSLSKFKKIEIILSIFLKHNTMRLEINWGGRL